MSAQARSWPGGGTGRRAGDGSSPRSGARAGLRRFKHWVRRLLRLRTGVKVDGVYFKELTAMPLARALSGKGPGQKDYRVTFRDRSKQVIHATPQRQYGDLSGPARLARYEAARGRLRPGMRILDVGCGTGYTSAWLAEQVGTYGAVVALEADEESVEFAQRRYRLTNVAFEVREPTSLDGETDESFDGAVWLQEEWTEDAKLLAELWRMVKPGGWLLMGPAPAEFGEQQLEAMLAEHAGGDRARSGGAGRKGGSSENGGEAETGEAGGRSGAPRGGGRPAAVIAGRPGRDLLIEKVADQRS